MSGLRILFPSLVCALVCGALLCAPPTDPTRDPSNARISVSVSEPAGTGDYMIGDTILLSIHLQLPAFIDSVKVEMGTVGDTTIMVTASKKETSADFDLSHVLPNTGAYTILATAHSSQTTSRTDSVTIAVKGYAPAVDVITEGPLSIREGEVCTLRVEADGTPPLSAAWYRNDEVLPDDTVLQLVVADSGIYRCVAANEWGSDTGKEVTVSLIGSPPSIITHSARENWIREGLRCTLYVRSEGDDIAFQWFRDSLEMAGQTNDTLLASDSGTYHCTVSNTWGTVWSMGMRVGIIAGDAPRSPGEFRISERTDAYVRLSWNRVDDAAGYRLYRNSSDTLGESPEALAQVTDTFYTDVVGGGYYYWLSAYNDNGSSEPAGPLFAPPGSSGLASPSGFQAVRVSEELVRLRWTPVQQASSYAVYRSAEGTDYVLLAEVGDTSYVDETSFDYYYYVRAANQKGVSGASDTAHVESTEPANTPPSWASDTMRFTIQESDSVRFTLSDSCTDADQGQTLSFELEEGTTASIENGVFVFRPQRPDSGTHTASVIASDGYATDTAVVLITVAPVYYTVTVNQPDEGGSIAVTPEKARYRWAESVTVTASAAEEYVLEGWSGDAATLGSTSPGTVAVTGDLTISATFSFVGSCLPVPAGENLSEVIREYSPSSRRPALLCPEPGTYSDETVEVMGKVQIVLQ